MNYTEYNLEIWGQNAMSNILYITGLPGSGKSSLAYDLAEEDDAYIIHLDYYTDDNAPANMMFDSYLDSNYPGWYNVREDYINGNDNGISYLLKGVDYYNLPLIFFIIYKE